ncbi:MAG: hypothetical protein ACOCOB_03670 [Prevotella sp.]
MKTKFEYAMNAIHYTLYKEEVWSNKKIGQIANCLIAVLSYIPFIRKYKKENNNQQEKELYDLFYGKEKGLSISLAHHLFGAFYSGYPMLLSFIIVGFIIRYCKEGQDIAIFMASFIPIGICYIPAYNAVFAKDRYLKYFKQFEKQDENWHKRWKRITLLFCIGSVLMFFISLGVVTLILS